MTTLSILDYFKVFLLGYLLVYLLINFTLRGKVSVGFISWLQVFHIKINLSNVTINLKSFSIQIRPLYYLYRNQLKVLHNDGFIVFHIYNLDCDTGKMLSCVPRKNLKSNNKKNNPSLKAFNLLKKLKWIFPITILFHDIKIKNGTAWLEIGSLSFSLNARTAKDGKSNGSGIENAINFTISDVSSPTGKLLVYSKGSVHSISQVDNLTVPNLLNLSASLLTHGINIDVDEVKTLISQLFPDNKMSQVKEADEAKSNVNRDLKKSNILPESVDRMIKRFGSINTYFAFDDTCVKIKGTTISMKNMSVSVSTIKKSQFLKCSSVSDLFKSSINFSSLTAKHASLKNSNLHIEFFDHVSILNVPFLVLCLKNIHDIDLISKLAEDGTFLARNFCTVTNCTLFLSLQDLLEVKNEEKNQKNIPETKRKHKDMSVITENILRLTHNIRTRSQFLTTNVQLHLADDISINMGVDDILFDSANTDSIGQLFDKNDYTATRSLFTAWRNLQICVLEKDAPTKIFTIELIDISCSIFIGPKNVKITDVSVFVNTVYLLLQDIQLMKKLSIIANNVVNHTNSFSSTDSKKSQDDGILDTKDKTLYIIDEESEGSNDALHELKEQPKIKSHLISEIVENIHFGVNRIKIVTCFENPVKYWDGEDQSSINKYKRGLCIALTDLSFVHDNTIDLPFSDIKVAYFSVKMIRDYDNEKEKENFISVFNLRKFHTKYSIHNHRLSIVFPLIDAMVSVEVLWTIFFLVAVFSSVKGRKLNSTIEKSHISIEKNKRSIDLLVSIPLLMTRIKLPSNIELALEVDSLRYTQMKHKDLRVNVARLYAQNPHAEGFWTLMIIIANARYRFIPKHLIPKDKIETHVICDSVRIEIPYQYVFYKAFDNFKAFFKSIKKLKLNFKDLMYVEETDKDFQVGVTHPHAIDFPFTFPTVRIKSKLIYYCNHDDPFEEELTRQLMLGQLEQKVRLTKYAAFAKYEEEMLNILKQKYKDCLKFDGYTALPPDTLDFYFKTPVPYSAPANSKGNNFESVSIPSKLSKQLPNLEHEAWIEYCKEYHFAIEIPRNKLYLNISKSWISRINTCRKTRKSERNFKGRLANEPKVRREFLEKFPVIVEGEIQPLFGFKVENAVLDLKEPDFGLANYPDFMHKTARGMPKDMKYGIFAAMNLKLSCSQTAIQIKDYPLPLVGFGGATDDGPKTVVFKGDLVICEQMNTPEEIRYNFVTCVPQYNDMRMKDSFYALHIPRTMTNIKFVTDMDVYVDSTRPACVSWSPALKPGIGYAFDSFDLLSKPPLDISEKIGFWDKLPMLIPSRFRFHLKNGITLFIKSSQSPYNLIGRNAGLAFKWDEDVLVSINKNDKPEDFLVVESRVFEIGVPVFDPQYVKSLLSHGIATAIDYDIAKVLLRLTSVPITWKLGFVFERNKNFEKNIKPGSVERTREFIPHYDVTLRNPSTFKSEEEKIGWDSYKGYRSDYMYMALTLYSRDDHKCQEMPRAPLGVAYNSVYLTPQVFYYFFYWWNSFTSKLGLPIKTGKLFKNEFVSDKKSPKFGNTLFGISYALDLSPLYLTHVYQHSALSTNGTNLAFTGLKCFVKSFTMDLHQSKREVIVLDNKTNTVSKQLKLSMDRCIIDFIDADLRILTAVFNQKSATGMLAKELGIEKSSIDFDNDSTSTESEDYMDRIWYDPNDFVELEFQHVTKEEPKWNVLQFASSPRFYYVRENHKPEVEFKFDAIESQTHHCQLNSRNFHEAAPALIVKRKSDIEELMKFYENEMKEASEKPLNEYSEKHISNLQNDIKDLKLRHELLHKLESKFKCGIFPDHDDFQIEEAESVFGYELTHGLTRVSTAVSNAKSRISDAYNKTSNYRNRFSVYAININWTRKIKLGFMRYLEKLKDRRLLSFSMSQQAIRMAEDLYKSLEKDNEFKSDLSFLKSDPIFEFNKSKELLEDFDQVLHDTTGMNESEVDDAYLVKLIMPQISIANNKTTCVQLSSNQIVLRNVVVNGWGISTIANELTLPMESRIGVTLTDAFVYVLTREDVLKNTYQFFTPKMISWPPKIPVEMYYYPGALDDCVVIQGLSCVLLYTKPNELHYSEGRETGTVRNHESVRVIAPDIIATVNSAQYATLYEVCTTFMQHEETDIKKMKKVVKNFLKYSDLTDYKELYFDLTQMQNDARRLLDYRRLLICLNFRNNNMNSEDLDAIIIELERILLNLNAMVDIIQTSKLKKYNKHEKISQWNIMAPAVKLVLMNDDTTALVEISAIDSYYMFSESSTGLSIHTAYIFDFAIFDKHKLATFETVATRLHDTDEEMCRIDWELNQSIGGIEVVKSKTIHFAPLKVEFDMRFSTAIQQFLFPQSEILQQFDFTEYDSSQDDFFDDSASINTDTSIGSLNNRSVHSSQSFEKDHSTISKVFHKLMRKKTSKALQSVPLSSKSMSATTYANNDSTLSIMSESTTKKHKSNVKIMEERSKKYFMVQDFKIDRVQVALTFRGSGKLKIVNLTDFIIQTPIIHIDNKITSYEELFAIVKHQLVNYVLKHTHSLIRSTFKTAKSSKGASEDPHINPLLKRKMLGFTPTKTLMDENKLHPKSHHHKTPYGDPDLMGPDFAENHPKENITHDNIHLHLPRLENITISETNIYRKLDDVEEE